MESYIYQMTGLDTFDNERVFRQGVTTAKSLDEAYQNVKQFYEDYVFSTISISLLNVPVYEFGE